MSLWLGDCGTPPQPAIGPRLRVYLLWGQSHLAGAKSFANGLPSSQWPRFGARIPGAWIWDKWGRPNRSNVALQDDQSGETHAWKPLTAGFGGGGPDYPWKAVGSNPSFGPEMPLAHGLRAYTGDQIAIVKFAVAGSQLAALPSVPDWNVQSLGQGNFAYLQILLESYWRPAWEAAQELAVEEGLQLTFGGVISMIGTSDARREADATAYQANLLACIDHIRGVLDPSGATSAPWLIIQSPRYVDPDGAKLAFIRLVRQSQWDAAQLRPGVTTLDSVDARLAGTHFDPPGTASLGQLMFRWAVRTPPIALPLQPVV